VDYALLTIFGIDFYRDASIGKPKAARLGHYHFGHHDIALEKAYMKPFLLKARNCTWIL
jgi:hypothetical protein